MMISFQKIQRAVSGVCILADSTRKEKANLLIMHGFWELFLS